MARHIVDSALLDSNVGGLAEIRNTRFATHFTINTASIDNCGSHYELVK